MNCIFTAICYLSYDRLAVRQQSSNRGRHWNIRQFHGMFYSVKNNTTTHQNQFIVSILWYNWCSWILHFIYRCFYLLNY